MQEVVSARVSCKRCGADRGISRLPISLGSTALSVHVAKFNARACLSLRSSLLKEAECLGVVLRDTFAPQIQIGKVVLAKRTACVRSFGSPQPSVGRAAR